MMDREKIAALAREADALAAEIERREYAHHVLGEGRDGKGLARLNEALASLRSALAWAERMRGRGTVNEQAYEAERVKIERWLRAGSITQLKADNILAGARRRLDLPEEAGAR